MRLLERYCFSFFHLLYPHTCNACGSDLVDKDMLLCLQCLSQLPHTSFAHYYNNPIEKIFTGRISLRAAHSEFYFMKNELVQTLLHQLKYKGNQEIGEFLGQLTGQTLLQSSRFSKLDYIVPLPLHRSKEHKRGYNQAGCIAKGISAKLEVPVLENNIQRKLATETQTRKNRADRWQNVSESFVAMEPEVLYGKNVLLVDDVITTGASIEACGHCILSLEGTSLSVASLAYASK